jgi:hypothetical protein
LKDISIHIKRWKSPFQELQNLSNPICKEKEANKFTKFATPSTINSREPNMRIVQAKLVGIEEKIKSTSGTTYPKCGRRFRAVTGRIVPPIEAPAATKPMAKPRRLLNQWATTAGVGEKTPPQPIWTETKGKCR